MTSEDETMLVRWLHAGTSLRDAEEMQWVGRYNQRYSDRAVQVYRFLWTWSAARYHGVAGAQQDAVYLKGGIKALNRRFARVHRIIARLLESSKTCVRNPAKPSERV